MNPLYFNSTLPLVPNGRSSLPGPTWRCIALIFLCGGRSPPDDHFFPLSTPSVVMESKSSLPESYKWGGTVIKTDEKSKCYRSLVCVCERSCSSSKFNNNDSLNYDIYQARALHKKKRSAFIVECSCPVPLPAPQAATTSVSPQTLPECSSRVCTSSRF